LISALLIIIVTTWYSVAIGIVFWPIAIYGLRKLATYDPQFFAIYRRHIRYAPLYKAHGTPWVLEKTKWGW
jgi:type IV secretory pathway TrbD component